MWWTTDQRVQRQSISFEKSPLPLGIASPALERAARKQRHLKLPISIAQAAANLILQEAGADCHAEVPRLRKDIQCLESALQTASKDNARVSSVVDRLRTENECLARDKQCHLETVERLKETVERLNEQVLRLQDERRMACDRTREERHWLMLAADLSDKTGHGWAKGHDAEQQVTDLMLEMKHLRAEKLQLDRRMALVTKDKKILSDVISDMESRYGQELKQKREQLRLLQKRLSQASTTDRAQVQHLNIKIVSQAAEIRSLEKRLAGAERNLQADGLEYQTVIDEHLSSADEPGDEFTERLENSLQAARVELDAAEHELKYANAQSERLRDHARQVEEQYDSDFQSVVQVAELHALKASRLEQSRELTSAAALSDASKTNGRETLLGAMDQKQHDDLLAENAALAHGLAEAEATRQDQSSSGGQTELHALKQELDSYREMQAGIAGKNEMLTGLNNELQERVTGLQRQLDTIEQKRADERAESERLLEHQKGTTSVATAECRLVKSQLEEQREKSESRLKQHLEVIQHLKSDICTARNLQVELETHLDTERLNRQLAEQHVKQVKQELDRLRESLPAEAGPVVREQPSVDAEDDDGSGARYAA